MPVLLIQSVECTQQFNASFSRKVSAHKTEPNRANFCPSSFIGFVSDDFLWRVKNSDFFVVYVLGQLKFFRAMRDGNNAKAIGAAKGASFQVCKKRSAFRDPRDGGFEEDEKWTAVDPDGVEA